MIDTAIDWRDLLDRLAEPFDESDIQYRAGATNKDKTKAIALAYAEPRTYEDRLNQLVPGDWQVTFQPWGENRIICHLTIHGITRSSTGESGDSNPDIAGTSAEAQAFKRACTKFGLGRYLYALPTTWVDYDPHTKQLLATPQLRGTPQKPTKPRQRAATASNAKPANGQAIGTARAVAMHEQLVKLGFERGAHKALATQALRRPVTHLKDLTEQEARVVWNHALARANEEGTVAA